MILGFPFRDKKNTATISCRHIMKDGKPILYVSHDADDGMWQFLCGCEHVTEDAMIVALEEIYRLDKTVSDIANLPYGHIAERDTKKNKWKISTK